MRKTVYIAIFLVTSVVANAQIGKRDSLLKLLPSAKEDTGKVMLLLKIADTYESNNQDSSIYYLEESKRLSGLLKFRKGLYHYYAQSVIVSFTKGDYDLAMKQSDDALAIARELKDSNYIINTLGNTGIVFQYTGQFDKELEYSLEALEIGEKGNHKEKLSSMYQSVGNAYYNLRQFRKAIGYTFLALKHHQETGSNSYPNRIFSSLGQNYAELKITDSALYYYKIAITESIKIGDKYAEAGIYGFMANTYADRSDFKEMLNVSDKSLSLSRELQSNQMLASSLYNIAYANYFNGDNITAKKNIKEALDIATKDSLKDELKNIYTVLSFVAARDGDFKASLWAKQKTDSIQDALLNEQVIKSTTELEKKYESEKKDKQIILQKSQLQKRRILNYVLIGSAVTILIISLLSYRNYKQKQKLQQQRISELEKERQLTATEAVLKGEEQERTRLAKDLHDGLGGMLSGIKYSFQTMKGNLVMTPDNAQAFERSMDMLDSSIKEMRRVAHNMMPEALVKFGLDTALKDFCNDINQSGALQVNYQSIGLEKAVIEQTSAITIYRIVQELINNTMKHAAAKTAIVQVSKTDGEISITVEDDGKGFNPVILEGGKGIGWSNIQSRVEYLKGKLDVQSQPGKGTSVHIELNA
jgi:two-component system, NarL family, sensor kinase